MKKLFIIILGCLLTVGCNQKASNEKTIINEKTNEELTTKELTYAYDQDKVEVNIKIAYPEGGNEILRNALREFFSESLGGSYDGDLADGQKMVDFYAEQMKAELIKVHEEQKQDLSEENISGFYKTVSIEKTYETDKLITFTVVEEIYTNGAHGMHYGYGQTFRKSDGRRFNTDMMCNLTSDGMHTLIKEGLREYFSEMSDEPMNDEMLKDNILTDNDIDYLPMPVYPPFVTEDGIVFGYQPYEISFYAAGMPSFVVSLNDMKPYLTNTARKMLGI